MSPDERLVKITGIKTVV